MLLSPLFSHLTASARTELILGLFSLIKLKISHERDLLFSSGQEPSCEIAEKIWFQLQQRNFGVCSHPGASRKHLCVGGSVGSAGTGEQNFIGLAAELSLHGKCHPGEMLTAQRDG